MNMSKLKTNPSRGRFALIFLIGVIGMIYGTSGLVQAHEDLIAPKYEVRLNQVHKGTQHIDTRLLDSYLPVEEDKRKYYLEMRALLEKGIEAAEQKTQYIKKATERGIDLIREPLLGNVTENSIRRCGQNSHFT